jgi:hypothetical protein
MVFADATLAAARSHRGGFVRLNAPGHERGGGPGTAEALRAARQVPGAAPRSWPPPELTHRNSGSTKADKPKRDDLHH